MYYKPPRLTLTLAAFFITILCLPVGALHAQESQTLYNLSEHTKLSIMGRYVKQADANQSVKVSYPGVTLAFTSKARRVRLQAKSNTGNGRLDVVVDGKLSHTLTIKKELASYPLIFSPNKLRHEVQLVNRSESWQSINQLISLEVENGQLLDPPVLPQRKLLVIGDSVTCGAAVSPGMHCDTQMLGHDIRSSYGYRLGQKLDAQVHLVCFGGRGLVRSWDENPDDIQAPAFFEKALPFKDKGFAWDHSNYSPDAVIVSLGTNDFNPGIPEESYFVDTYVEFLQRINELHPSAKILITEGAMLNNGNPELQNKTVVLNYLKQVVDKAGLEQVSHETANHYPGDSCDSHPNASQHEKMAQDLARALRQKLNW